MTILLASILRASKGALFLIAGLVLAGCTQPASIVGIDGATGAEKWRLQDGTSVFSCVGDLVLVVRDEHLAALDGRTGQPLWKSDLQPALDRRPLDVGGAIVVVSANQDLCLVDAKDGAVRWRVPFGRGGLVLGSSDDGSIAALGTAPESDGALELRQIDRLGAAHGRLRIEGLELGAVARLTVAGAIATIASHDGDLVVVDFEAGTVYSSGEIHPAIAPCIAGSRVVAVRKDGSLVMIDAKTGEEGWRIGALPTAATLGVANGIIWLGGSHGALVGVEIDSGEIRFSIADSGTDGRIVRDSRLLGDPTPALILQQGTGLAIVDATKGKVATRFEIRDLVATFARIGPRAFTRTDDGRVAGFDLENRRKAFESNPGSRAETAIVVVTRDGTAVL